MENGIRLGQPSDPPTPPALGDRLRVLQVIPSLSLGGAEQVAAFLAAAFADPGRPSLCAIAGGPYSGYLRQRSVQYALLDGRPAWRRWAGRLRRALRPAAAPQALSLLHSVVLPPQWDVLQLSAAQIDRFSRLLRAHKYDVVHFHTLPLTSLCRTARHEGVSVVYGHHNMLSERHLAADVLFLRQNLAWVDQVVCVGRAAREDFSRATSYPEGRTWVIAGPSFLARDWEARPQSPLTAGTASNLQGAKGLETLLDGWRVLAAAGRGRRLRIAGGAPGVVRYWQTAARRMGLGPDVEFLGPLTREAQMDQFYGSIGVLVIPSLTESLSLQAVEAMSRGIPVVASDLPALREALGNAGLFFPPGDARALAARVATLWSDEGLYSCLSKAGQLRYRERFAPAPILARYRQVYAAALGQGPGPEEC